MDCKMRIFAALSQLLLRHKGARMSREEQIRMKHSTLLTEYKALRDENVSTMNASRSILNIAVTALGGLIAASPYIIPPIVQWRMPILFLVFPLFFCGLAWAQLRYIFLVHDLSHHLSDIVLPQIRQCLAEMAPMQKRDFELVMAWETKRGSILRHHSLLFLPIEGAHFGIPLLGAILSLSVYFVLTISYSWTIPLLDGMLITLNLLALAYSIFAGFRTELRR
jgi:hypothetical protein